VARSICFYTDSASFGGAEQALLMLAGGLDRRRWTPSLLLDAGSAVDEIAARAQAAELPTHVVEAMPLGLSGARRVPSLAARLRGQRPDVFHAHLSWPLAAKYALAAAVVARVPAIVATVQLVPDFEVDRSSLLQLRALSAGIGRYIAVSHEIAALLEQRFRLPARKIEVVHNAVRLEQFALTAPPRLHEGLGGRPGRAIVLTCARLHPQKGHDTLLRAAAEVPDATFVLAGDGPERGALEARALELGVADRVRFLGHRDDVAQLLAATDVFALPSLYEGSSLSILEAMAARRAIVASAIGGTTELLEPDRTGVLVPPGDPTALAVQLRRLLRDPQLRAALGTAAYQRVKQEFTAENMTARVTRIYGQLLERRRTGDV
jgi:glycosyltransferase involved in cell wall biosynthesis